MPDFRHWTSVVLEAAAFLSISLWAIRSVIREAKDAIIEMRTYKAESETFQLNLWSRKNRN